MASWDIKPAEHRQTWEITPFTNVGPLSFGSSPEQVRHALDASSPPWLFRSPVTCDSLPIRTRSRSLPYRHKADRDRRLCSSRAGSHDREIYLPGMELSVNGTTVSGTRYYAFAGRTVAIRTPAGISFEAADHHRTGTCAIDTSTGAITWRRTTPYGGSRGTPPAAWPHQKGFIGGTQDPTGMTHLGAREYDPGIGRFVSVDPIIDMQDPQQMQGYSYALNSPLVLSDPDGRRPIDEMGIPCTKAEGSSSAHGVAVALRVAYLQMAFPHAVISSDPMDTRHGPDIVCWDCVPDQVWVWEVKSGYSGDPSGTYEADKDLFGHMLYAQNAPLGDGKDVVRGPMSAFGPVPPNAMSGVNPMNERQVVTVRSVVDGVELYDVKEYQDEEAVPGGKKMLNASRAALKTAHRLNDDFDKLDQSLRKGRRFDEGRTPGPSSRVCYPVLDPGYAESGPGDLIVLTGGIFLLLAGGAWLLGGGAAAGAGAGTAGAGAGTGGVGAGTGAGAGAGKVAGGWVLAA
ncbi:RHS repeat domain-containing protein [Catellatospora aurea]|uniref:RHS repeat domain-containing protein n=1 Tax=Catellatospora aurea TaxID=1337874 RepID=A0ABW2H4J5_9ACTN